MSNGDGTHTRKETVSLTTDSSKYDTDITLDSRTLDVDDFANITDLKADDYVLVTAVNNNSRYEVKSIDKAEVVNGTVEGYKDGSNVTMGGTKYEYSATADNIKKTSYNVGREASLVLDSYGYVIAVDESVVLSDYVYIAEFGSSSGMTSTSRALANAIFPDGTTDEIVVDKAYDKKAGEQVSSKSTIAGWRTDAEQIGWFTYSKNSADEYTLYAVESKYDEEIASYSGKGTVSENSKVAPFENDSNSTTKADLSLANDETIVIVSDKNDDLYVYTGVKNFPAIEQLSCTPDETGRYREGLSQYDAIFNTVPAPIFSVEQLKALRPDCFYIELASSPGGISPDALKPAHYIPAPGLPGKTAPKTAAAILFRAMCDSPYLSRQEVL